MATWKWQSVLLALAVAIGAASGSWFSAMRFADGDRAACASGSTAMRRVELVFGLSRKDRTDVGDTDWAAFLEREVTPRFPDGLTVMPANGQWRSASGVIVKEPARLMLIWAHAAPDLDQRIEEIRSAWKREHNQESVLRADSRDCVSF
ncbi:MAG: DUF3574 domain-containing protein [Hyphomicrobiaceae bacterium]